MASWHTCSFFMQKDRNVNHREKRGKCVGDKCFFQEMREGEKRERDRRKSRRVGSEEGQRNT